MENQKAKVKTMKNQNVKVESLFTIVARLGIDFQVILLLLRPVLAARMSREVMIQLRSELLVLLGDLRLVFRIIRRMVFIGTNYNDLIRMREIILAYVRVKEYYVRYEDVMDAMGIDGQVINLWLCALGDLDRLEGLPRTDALVGNGRPSEGHYDRDMTPFEQIEAHEQMLADLCNHHGFRFKYEGEENGEPKFYYRTKGMNWFKSYPKSRGPIRRITEPVRPKAKKAKKRNGGHGPAAAPIVVQ